jgi:Retrotransposon gag protein
MNQQQMVAAFKQMQEELVALRTAAGQQDANFIAFRDAAVKQDASRAIDIQSLAASSAAAAAAAAPAPARGPSLRIAPPAHYNGSTPPLDDWLASMRQQFAFYQLAADAVQVRFAAAHLKGPALDWWEHPGAAGEPTTWLEVDAGLRARFQPVTTADTARRHLATLEQGKHSINDYVAIFRRLIVAVPTMDAESQLFAFTHGLNKTLYMLSRQVMPATLEEAISLAVRMGTAAPSMSSTPSGSGNSPMDLSALLAELDGREAESTTAPSAEAKVTRAEYTTLLAAIQQSNNRRGGDSAGSNRGAQGASGGFEGPRGLPRVKGFSPEKVQHYMDANKCFGCHKVGHRSGECPLRKVDANGRATWSN